MRRVIDAAWRAPRLALVGLVRAYRLLLSPWLGNSCRFEPTCSRYAIAALERHGAVVGTLYAGWRVLRCNPWCDGGCDPVPDNQPWERASAAPSAHPAAGLFTRSLGGRSCLLRAATSPSISPPAPAPRGATLGSSPSTNWPSFSPLSLTAPSAAQAPGRLPADATPSAIAFRSAADAADPTLSKTRS